MSQNRWLDWFVDSLNNLKIHARWVMLGEHYIWRTCRFSRPFLGLISHRGIQYGWLTMPNCRHRDNPTILGIHDRISLTDISIPPWWIIQGCEFCIAEVIPRFDNSWASHEEICVLFYNHFLSYHFDQVAESIDRVFDSLVNSPKKLGNTANARRALFFYTNCR